MSVLNQLNSAIARNKSKGRKAAAQTKARKARSHSPSSSATRKAVTSLRRSGYAVSEVELPDGTKIVLKSTRKAAKKTTTRKKAPRKKAAKKAAKKSSTKRSPAQIAATKRMLAANKKARAAKK